MSEGNKAIVKQFYHALNQGKTAALTAAEQVVTPEYVLHDPASPVVGRQALEALLASLYDGLPDLLWSVDELLADGDRVTHRFSFCGTHNGDLMGFPPTGKKVHANGISVVRVADGKIAEEWQVWDAHGFFQQISPVEQNKAAARRWFNDVLNNRDLATAAQICVEDLRFHAWHWPDLHGLEGVKQFVYAMQSMSPDFRYSVDDVIAEGDKVDVRWTFRGTNAAEAMGMPPTGKSLIVPGCSMFQLANGKIVEHWGYWDALGMVHSISSTGVAGVESPVKLKAESAG